MPRRPPKPLPTPEAALSALRHGITSRTLAISGLEEHADWIRHRDKVVESLEPEGELESELATSVAEYTWRRRRVARHEHNLIAVERERDILKDGWQDYKKQMVRTKDVEPASPAEQGVAATNRGSPDTYDLAMNARIDATIRPERMLPAGDDLDRIIRYETHLMRQAYHALHELQALQSRRRGEPAPLARLSVVGFSGA